MSFQLKTREQTNISDPIMKQKIIDQLKNEVETLKAKFILDEKSRSFNDRNNLLSDIKMNTKQSEEFAHTLPRKQEKEYFNSNLKRFSPGKNNHFDQNDSEGINNNCLEKNDSVIINDNNMNEDFIDNYGNFNNPENDLNDLYPKAYKKENLNLDNLNDLNCLSNKPHNNFTSHNIQPNRNLENDAKINYTNTCHAQREKVFDFDFDKAKENLLKIRNDLDELDKYDIHKNRSQLGLLSGLKTKGTQQNE